MRVAGSYKSQHFCSRCGTGSRQPGQAAQPTSLLTLAMKGEKSWLFGLGALPARTIVQPGEQAG